MKNSTGTRKLIAALIVLLFSALALAADVAQYQQSIETWRKSYEQGVKGWLRVSGLFWLHEGENRFGSDPLNDIVLPTAPGATLGYFEYHAGKTVVHVNPGAPVTMQGKPLETAELHAEQDYLVMGDLALMLHSSGDRYAIRLIDKNSSLLKNFTGLQWYPVSESYRLNAHYVPFDSPKVIDIPNIAGDSRPVPFSGYVSFSLRGQEYRLEVQTDEARRIYIVFRDLTSGKETYPAARFLEADPPKDGIVLLDFNKAHNPPCAYNPYTTCPLPPQSNRLRVEIQAGEKAYKHD